MANPYSGKTLAELKAVDWKELPLDELRRFEAAVKDLAKDDLPAYNFWLEVLVLRVKLEVKQYNL